MNIIWSFKVNTKNCLLVGSCFLALSSVGHAGDFYVGVGAGYGFGSAKATGDLRTINHGSQNTDVALKGLQGILYAGSGKPVCSKKVYIGGELSGDLSNVKGKDKSPIVEGAARLTGNSSKLINYRYGFSASLKGGVFLDRTKLIYVKAGPTMGSWSLKTQTDTLDQNGLPAPQTANRTSNLMGIKVALGAEAEIASNTYAGFEYSYALYQKMSVKKTASTGQNFSYQTQPSLGVFMLTLTRKF